MEQDRVRPLRAAIIALMVALAATLVAHSLFVVPEGWINERGLPGPVGWIFYLLTLPAWPGVLLCWMLIWGDSATGSLGEVAIEFVVSLAFNGTIAFGLGYIPLSIWQSQNRLQFGIRSIFIAVTFAAIAAAVLTLVLR
ncbi:MAG TPA: hypothetical protein VFE62_09995 [Gemmataceae bacterium]|nr:hypothetical protein [Gemmataceae bacterium]